MNPDSPRLAGFVFDTFATGLKDVSNEFGIPWYVFSAAGAAFIGSMLHLTALHDEQGVDITEITNSEDELEIPSLANPSLLNLCLPRCSRNTRSQLFLYMLGY
jgi:hypothetical protein